jgi:hypothetical protein
MKKNYYGKSSKDRMPKVGDDIYLGTELYLGHGRDDFDGGLCRIVKITSGISAGKKTPFVEVKERPNHEYNLEYLLENQEEWKKEYGRRRGKACPDYSPEFNEGW